MLKYLFVVGGLFAFSNFLSAQVPSHPDLSDYSDSKKKLLVISTSKFIYANGQGQIDADSSMLLSCRIYGVNRMLPYYENNIPQQVLKYISLLDSGKVSGVQARLNELNEKNKVPISLLLGTYFLYKAGDEKADLRRAEKYILNAVEWSKTMGSLPFMRESSLLAARYFARIGVADKSNNYFTWAEELDLKAGNQLQLAQDYLYHGENLPYNHPEKLTFLKKSYLIFEKYGVREKQIEVLMGIIGVHFLFDWKLTEKELLQSLALQKQIGFRHLHLTYSVLSYLYDMRQDEVVALDYANKCLQTMRETGDEYLISVGYMRIGNIYNNLKKHDEAQSFFQKSYGSMDPKTMIFWDKSLFTAVYDLANTDQPSLALHLIEKAPLVVPALTLFDKIHVTYLKGLCYERLNDPEKANTCYSDFDSLAGLMPAEFIHAELPNSYLHLSEFYFYRKDLKKARKYFRKANEFHAGKLMVGNLAYLNLIQFEIDSIDGKYLSAIKDHIKFKLYSDSANSISQSKQVNELLIKYEAGKKDNNILLLTKEAKIQKVEIARSQVIRNVTVVTAMLILLIAVLIYNLYQNKKRTNEEIAKKNASLEELVKEKEWLVQEIHHRVKNNLHTVIALLESQSVYLQNDALQAIRDSQHRIFAMSLTHQKLYQSADLTTIDMLSYLSELIIYMRESFETKNNIVFDVKIDPIELDVSQAVPLGLIINESMTNALKYAFPNDQTGIINISMNLNTATEDVHLCIEDNGIGLPANYNSHNSSSLGMKLMKGLSKEIHAAFDIQSSSRGTKIYIRFRKSNISRPNTVSA